MHLLAISVLILIVCIHFQILCDPLHLLPILVLVLDEIVLFPCSWTPLFVVLSLLGSIGTLLLSSGSLDERRDLFFPFRTESHHCFESGDSRSFCTEVCWSAHGKWLKDKTILKTSTFTYIYGCVCMWMFVTKCHDFSLHVSNQGRLVSLHHAARLPS